MGVLGGLLLLVALLPVCSPSGVAYVSVSNTEEVVEALQNPSLPHHVVVLAAGNKGDHSTCPPSAVPCLQLDVSGLSGGTSVDTSVSPPVLHVRPATTVAELYRHQHDTPTIPASHTLPPVGVCGGVTVGGLALGGGVGYMSRSLGATVDHLQSATVVLANGSVVVTTASSHSDDLWFALRGAGGGFGVVTALTFRLPVAEHPVVFAGVKVWPLTALPDVAAAFRSAAFGADGSKTHSTTIGRPFCVYLVFMEGMVGVQGLWYGDPGDGQHALRRLLAVPGGRGGFSPQPLHTALSSITSDPTTTPSSVQHAVLLPRASVLPGKFQAVIAAVRSAVTAVPASASYVAWVAPWGGALTDRDTDSAFTWRRNAQAEVVVSVFTVGDAAVPAPAVDPALLAPFKAAIAPLAMSRKPSRKPSQYVNQVFQVSEADAVRLHHTNLPRLLAVKAAVDPSDRFHLPGHAATYVPPG